MQHEAAGPDAREAARYLKEEDPVTLDVEHWQERLEAASGVLDLWAEHGVSRTLDVEA